LQTLKLWIKGIKNFEKNHDFNDGSLGFDHKFNYTVDSGCIINKSDINDNPLKSIANEMDYDDVAQEYAINETPNRFSKRMSVDENFYSTDSPMKGKKTLIQNVSKNETRVKKGQVINGK